MAAVSEIKSGAMVVRRMGAPFDVIGVKCID